jgi:hypothetical protein
VEAYLPDGRQEVLLADGSAKVVLANGMEELVGREQLSHFTLLPAPQMY